MIELFPNEDYRFQLRLERGSVAEFFGATPAHRVIVAERQRWLDTAPRTYAVLLPEGEPLLEEAMDILFAGETERREIADRLPPRATAWDRCVALGRECEPDFLLLRPGPNSRFHLFGACVCFPSSWNLAEKMGRPLEFIHGVVPGLNQQVGVPIHGFLTRIKPGVAWLRSNWGLSRSAERNQHPERNLPRLDESVNADEVWLRVEDQALVALPRTSGVLFGIRIRIHPLSEVKRDVSAARGLARALRTMPEEVALYKGLASARARILALLE